MKYIAAPLILKAGISTPHYWALLRLGGMGQLNFDSKLEWVIDGRNAIPGSDRMPAVTIRQTTSSYIGGLEAGIRFGNNGLFLMSDYIYGRTKIASGLSGSAYHRAFELFFGYRRFLF
jgi:hypothetical protein